MKTEQENPGAEYNPASPKKVLPAFTTERMLMGYFVMHFNTREDVQSFYKEARRLIKNSSVTDQGKLQGYLQKINDLVSIIKQLPTSFSSPYKGATLENGNTKAISGVSANGNVKFSSGVFQDCADIAARHIINLLLYSINDDWSTALKGNSSEELEQKLEQINSAITNGQEIPFRTLRERLQLFFYHQSKVGVDAGDITTRSLWNYVVSNMRETPEPGMYAIKYVGNKNYELETGFLNSIKLVFNMATALNGESPSLQEKFAKAKTDIAALEGVINTGAQNTLEEKLKSAMESTFKLINGSINLKGIITSGISIEKKHTWKDCFGKIEVELKGKSSSINFRFIEEIGHGRVAHQATTSFTEEFIRQNKTILASNELAKIFVLKFAGEFVCCC
ncbi:MAG: hypothetical protein RUMPE_01306 [Eubacteriales bacterium SKADARSKE-1]|nr:hypothetical protein [Eubacteriales bacterium SKADARSKE-1]